MNEELINAGELNRQIKLMKRTKVQNAYNEEIDNYSQLAEVWAGIKMTTNTTENKEETREHREKLKETFEFTIRYLSCVNKHDMAILYKNRYYEIISIDNVKQANTKLIIIAECKGDDMFG